MTQIHHIRQGHGPPLLLIHGLGGSWRSLWPVLGALAAEREVIAVDLPGFGETAPLSGEISIRTLAAGRSVDWGSTRGSCAGGCAGRAGQRL